LSEKYLRKLIGKAEIEDALKRLDKLTNEEVRMVTAEVLDATHIVNDRVVRMDNRVAHVDEGVTRVDDRVAHVDEGVARVENRVNAIDDRVAAGIDGAQPSFISHQETMFNLDVLRDTTSGRQHGSSQKFVIFFLPRYWCANSSILTGNQLRQDLRRWLSPPDPSINHNIACGAYHKKTSEWFFRGSIFTEWKSNGSFLWLHGKRTFS